MKFGNLLKKVLVGSIVISSAFFITGCQNNNQSENNEISKNAFNFFSLGGNSKKSLSGNLGKRLNLIDNYFEYTVSINVDENIKLIQGVQLPIFITGKYYVYKNDVSSNVFKAGTNIGTTTATITYRFGGSSSLNINPNQGSISVNLANLVPEENNNYKVVPSVITQQLATLELSDPNTIMKQKIFTYLCYPVYKESEFNLEVPASNTQMAVKQGKVKLVPNNGEIKFTINYVGQPSNNNDYIYILTIKPELGKIKLNPEGNSWVSLATEDMTSCGEIKPAKEGGKFNIFIKLEGPENANIECNPQVYDNIYDLKILKNQGLICKIRTNREETEQILNFKLKTAYTIVKKDTSKELGVLLVQ